MLLLTRKNWAEEIVNSEILKDIRILRKLAHDILVRLLNQIVSVQNVAELRDKYNYTINDLFIRLTHEITQ